MRVIAVIDDPKVTEKILRHLGAWHDPPPRPATPGAAGVYTYERRWTTGCGRGFISDIAGARLYLVTYNRKRE